MTENEEKNAFMEELYRFAFWVCQALTFLRVVNGIHEIIGLKSDTKPYFEQNFDNVNERVLNAENNDEELNCFRLQCFLTLVEEGDISELENLALYYCTNQENRSHWTKRFSTFTSRSRRSWEKMF